MADSAAEVTGLRATYGPEHPLRRTAEERAGLLRDLVTAAAEEQGVAAELKALQDQSRQLQNRMIGLMDAAARLERSERDFRVAETVLASTMARSKTAKADRYASYLLVQALEDRLLPSSPSSPKRVLAGVARLSLYLGTGIRPDLRATGPVPGLVWVWCAGMLALLVTLWIGHVNWGSGRARR